MIAAGGVDLLFPLGVQFNHTPCAFDIGSSRRCGHHAGALSFKQRLTDVFLQLGKHFAQRGLGYIQALGGLAHIALLGNGQDILALPQMHDAPPSLYVKRSFQRFLPPHITREKKTCQAKTMYNMV